MAEETLLVGIDVSRRWLDVHLHPVGEALRVANDAQGHALLAARLEGQVVLAVGLEASGG
jgi:transposase